MFELYWCCILVMVELMIVLLMYCFKVSLLKVCILIEYFFFFVIKWLRGNLFSKWMMLFFVWLFKLFGVFNSYFFFFCVLYFIDVIFMSYLSCCKLVLENKFSFLIDMFIVLFFFFRLMVFDVVLLVFLFCVSRVIVCVIMYVGGCFLSVVILVNIKFIGIFISMVCFIVIL